MTKVSEPMLAAWVDYEPPSTAGAMTHREIGYQRHAFYAGFLAAIEAAAAIADDWAEKNKAAKHRALRTGRARYDFDGDETQLVMAEQIEGAEYECRALAETIRALKSDPASEDCK